MTRVASVPAEERFRMYLNTENRFFFDLIFRDPSYQTPAAQILMLESLLFFEQYIAIPFWITGAEEVSERLLAMPEFRPSSAINLLYRRKADIERINIITPHPCNMWLRMAPPGPLLLKFGRAPFPRQLNALRKGLVKGVLETPNTIALFLALQVPAKSVAAELIRTINLFLVSCNNKPTIPQWLQYLERVEQSV